MVSNDGIKTPPRPARYLISREQHNKARALEILAAMNKCVMDDKPIPAEWFSELSSYYGQA